MTTDPGDLVMDITCGSGTTAYVAEQGGRRRITCDTSRVPLALARQRKEVGGLVPRIKLETMANNTVFRAKTVKPYPTMLQRFASWKSALMRRDSTIHQ